MSACKSIEILTNDRLRTDLEGCVSVLVNTCWAHVHAAICVFENIIVFCSRASYEAVRGDMGLES